MLRKAISPNVTSLVVSKKANVMEKKLFGKIFISISRQWGWVNQL